MTENIQQYLNQIALARTEIKNLRQQLSALKHEHLKEIKCIKNALESLRCASCENKATAIATNDSAQPVTNTDGCIPFRPIGVIRTTFQNKRGVPRQTSILASAKGMVEIDMNVFTNPEHAMYGLEEFSHMWIMFHFHMTDSNSAPAMVSPPRLGGERRGVLSTRSPHRPCPIGLSLVKITNIEGNKIHFLGVDMVNGTPVLDVKPYIPQYDLPSSLTGELSDRPRTEGISDVAQTIGSLRLGDSGSTSRQPRGDSSIPGSPFENMLSPDTSPISTERHSERGAPDGQEHFTPQSAPTIDTFTPQIDNVRIAPWISNPPSQVFEVTFTTEAYDRLTELIGDRAPAFKSNIQSLLSEDPRSHYVRTRYPDHEFSCVLEDLSISCIFDAGSAMCTIIAVRNPEDMQQS